MPMRLSRLAPLIGLGLAPAIAVGACYGATEVALEITTDRACSDELKTTVYRGDYRTSAHPPSAVVAGCPGAAAGAGERTVGSIVVVPSGSRSGEAAVTVVMRVDGKEPDACLKDRSTKDACIIATRSFKFIEHTSLTLPVLLSDACRGVECEEGQTCGSGGVCVDQRVTCGPEGCDVEPTSPGAGDAGPDASGAALVADAAPDGSPPMVCGVPNSVLWKEDEMPTFAAASGKNFYYVSPDSKTLYRVRPNAIRTQVFPPPLNSADPTPNPTITALTARGDLWGIGTKERAGDAALGAYVRRSDGGPVPLVGVMPVDSIAFVNQGKVIGETTKMYGVSKESLIVFEVDSNGTFMPRSKEVPVYPPVAVDEQAVYVVGDTDILALPRADAGGEPVPLGFHIAKTSHEEVIFASNDDSVFAAGLFGDPPQSTWEIRKLALTSAGAPALTQLSGAVSALAADANAIYWIPKSAQGINSGLKIHRQAFFSTPGGGTGEQELEIANAEKIAHLSVDGECVYYWTFASGALSDRAKLRASPKTDFH